MREELFLSRYDGSNPKYIYSEGSPKNKEKDSKILFL